MSSSWKVYKSQESNIWTSLICDDLCQIRNVSIFGWNSDTPPEYKLSSHEIFTDKDIWTIPDCSLLLPCVRLSCPVFLSCESVLSFYSVCLSRLPFSHVSLSCLTTLSLNISITGTSTFKCNGLVQFLHELEESRCQGDCTPRQ